MQDKEVYDLASFKLTGPKDYTHREGDLMYVVNFCKPAIKVCNGIEEAFASMWNMSTFECIDTLAENDPTARYIDPNNPAHGILLEYKGRYTTVIEIECDQAFEKAGLIKAVKASSNPDIFKFSLKSKHVCRNFAEAEAEGWGWFTKLIFIIFICFILYLVIGMCINMRTSSYTSFSDSIPHKEFWLSVGLKIKQGIRNCVNPSEGENNGPSHIPTT
jgi:hypothetical protein